MVTKSKWYIDKISVDSHEKKRGSHAVNYYIKDNYNARIEPLAYGDYLFQTNDGEQVVFEYKTYHDLINSMENHTVFNELANQSMNYDYSYLVVEGDLSETVEYLYFNVQHYRYKYKTLRMIKNRLPNQVNGALNRIYSMYVPIVFAEDESEAFNKMLTISSKIADNKKYGGIVRPNHKDLKENECAMYLTSIKHIGEVKAKNITNELSIDCLEDLVELKPSDFRSVAKLNDKNICDIWFKVHAEHLETDRDGKILYSKYD